MTVRFNAELASGADRRHRRARSQRLRTGAHPLTSYPLAEGSGRVGCIASAPEASATGRHLQEIPRVKGPRRYHIEGSRPRARPRGMRRAHPARYRVQPVYRPARFITGWSVPATVDSTTAVSDPQAKRLGRSRSAGVSAGCTHFTVTTTSRSIHQYPILLDFGHINGPHHLGHLFPPNLV
jgi:hypothetical protein